MMIGDGIPVFTDKEFYMESKDAAGYLGLGSVK